MKRTAARILLFLLIGAVINVAVAWGCVAWSPLENNKQIPSNWHPDRSWPVSVPTGWPRDFGAIPVQTGYGIRVADAAHQLLVAGDGPKGTSITYAEWGAGRLDAGWPMVSLSACYIRQTPFSSSPWNTSGPNWTTGISVPGIRASLAGRSLPLPWGPLWMGALVNSALYGVLGAAAVFGWRYGRRILRARRSLCAHCAYPIGTSPVCTECGKPVKPRSGAPA